MPKESTQISVWNQRSLGIDLKQDLSSVNHDDIDYLCNNRYPFLQLVNSDAVFSSETEINFITASTGWIIHDYGEAISTSITHNKDQEQKNRGLIDQINTVSEIAKLIATKEWENVELIAGSQLMNRFLWIESKRYGFKFVEYTPTPDDENCYARVLKFVQDSGAAWEKKIPAKPEEEEVVGMAWGEEPTGSSPTPTPEDETGAT